MNNIRKTSFNEIFIFFLIFISFLFFLDFQSFFFLKPRSFHFIRQTDTLSFVSYYLLNGVNFFDTGNLNLYNNTGKAVCEFPGLYYITALITYFGFESYKVLKIVHLVIFFFSSFILYKYLRQQFNFINSLSIVFLLFSSTVILYYSINYIPNFPALCFSICGVVYFFIFLENNIQNKLITSLLFFLFACLLKITFAIYPITCFLMLFYRFFKQKKIDYKIVFLFSGLFVILIVWNLYVIHYNKINNSEYYLTNIKPIWNANSNEFDEVFSFILNYWTYKYYYPSTIHVFIITVFISLFFYKKINKFHFIFILFSFIGVISYFVLFFKQFRDHDYYFMEFVPFFLIVFIATYNAIIESVPVKIAITISIVLLVITVLSINYAKLNIQRRYDKPFEQVSYLAKELENIESKIDSIGIPKYAKILVIPDNTMNGSLYYLNRFGYTVGDTASQNLVAFYKKSDYILITDSSVLQNIKSKFGLKKSILKYRGVGLYKIKPY